ncbi:MAG: transglutaminase-like domain-containing protein [Firmicutes bacterium]|nr:transglutaminase-like domain-containing protein [Bacillota bacterium]
MDGTADYKRRTKNKNSKKNSPPRICCLPENQERTTFSLILGFVCRVLVIAAAVTGLSLFFTDAMAIVSEIVPFSAVLIPALIFTFIISALFINRYTAVGGTLLLVGGVFAWIAAKSADVFEYAWASVRIFVNAVIERISFAGLVGIQAYSLSADYGGYVESELMETGVALFTLIVAILFVPAMIRRVHIFYVVAGGAVFTVPLFAYNIMRDNWGSAVLASALAAVVVLYMFDRLYTRSAKNKLIIKDIKDTSFTEIAAGEKKKAAAVNAEMAAAASAERISAAYETGEAEESGGKKKKIRRRRGKDKNIEAALTLETPQVRRARLHAEREEKKRAKRALAAEKKQARKKQKLKLSSRERLINASLGGPGSLAVFALLMLAVLIPAAVIEDYQDGIPYISEIMATSRTYVTAFLMGDEIDLNEVGSIEKNGYNSGSHSIAIDYPSYSDILIATVEVPYDTPVYLRTWVATEYDDDMWYTADYYDILEYRELFGSDFTPESITETFYEAVYPNFTRMSDSAGYKANVKYGFITERVNVTREYGNGVLLYLPSLALPSYGLSKYISTESSLLPYSAYFDGIWTSKYFFEDTQYSTVSLVTTMVYDDIEGSFASMLEYYSYSMDLIMSGEADSHIGDEDYVTAYEETLVSAGVEYSGDSILRRYLLSMTEAEREDLREDYELEREYSEYAADVYTQTDEDDNEAIRAIAESILLSSDVSSEVIPIVMNGGSLYGMDEYYYEVVMALVDYLSDVIEYSITGTDVSSSSDETATQEDAYYYDYEEYDLSEEEENYTDEGSEFVVDNLLATVDVADLEDEEDYVDEESGLGEEEEEQHSAILDFLMVSRTGYCVQYASAVTMMLRSLGIPARYCEGFLASEFSTSRDNDALVRYSCGVLDSDAHAWVEVYYDYMGWMQYEVTQPYLEGMYGTDGSSGGSAVDNTGNDTPSIDYTDPVDNDDTDIDPEKVGEEEGIDLLLVAAVAAAVIAVIALIILIIELILSLHKTGVSVRKRREMTERAADLLVPLTDDEVREFAYEMSHGVFELYKLLGFEPKVGELSDEYATRVAEALGDASKRTPAEILGYIAKEEFGYGMSRRELAFLAEYYRDLTSAVYDGLGFRNKFVFRYVKRAV